ncbi:AraC family transcriptional regulator [Pseudomonas sp. AA-38]|uniref:AraC family transcriptional regulator n=1 Tax=Pseudomonas sp. AA-38 TaxID=3028807 RepID=UPI0023F9CE05|nr:AraC family transcriptional regulator [Pseudomonas sp. AA-38]
MSADSLEQPDARVTIAQYMSLFRSIMEALDDEGVGLFSRRLRRGSLALMVQSVVGSSTFEGSIRQACKAMNLLHDDVTVLLIRDGAMAGLRIDIPPSYLPERAFAHEILVIVLLRLMNWLYGQPLPNPAFDLATPQPKHVAECEQLLPGKIRFDRPSTIIWFGAEALSQRWQMSLSEIKSFIARTPDILVAPQRLDQPTSAKVRAFLLQNRLDWPELGFIAKALHVSTSTLQRDLNNEGISFRMIKNQLRRDIAIERLTCSDVPLSKLAEELGFSDSAAFQRAFKAWTGEAPGSYRKA